MDPPVVGNRVFSEKITREVVNMMEKVAIKNGRAMVEGYRVGIKTGTAKKLENGRYVDKYVAYTAGIAPITDPRYALVVLINDPKSRSILWWCGFCTDLLQHYELCFAYQ